MFLSDKNLFPARLVAYSNTAASVGLLKMENKENSKWYRGGRPRLDDEEKAIKRVQVRFTPDEYEQVLALKSKTKSRTMSDFIRKICLRKPLRMKLPLSTYQESVLVLVREMRTDVLRIGVRVSQANKHIMDTSNDERLRKEAEQVWADLTRLEAGMRAVMIAVRERGENPT